MRRNLEIGVMREDNLFRDFDIAAREIERAQQFHQRAAEMLDIGRAADAFDRSIIGETAISVARQVKEAQAQALKQLASVGQHRLPDLAREAASAARVSADLQRFIGEAVSARRIALEALSGSSALSEIREMAQRAHREREDCLARFNSQLCREAMQPAVDELRGVAESVARDLDRDIARFAASIEPLDIAQRWALESQRLSACRGLDSNCIDVAARLAREIGEGRLAGHSIDLASARVSVGEQLARAITERFAAPGSFADFDQESGSLADVNPATARVPEEPRPLTVGEAEFARFTLTDAEEHLLRLICYGECKLRYALSSVLSLEGHTPREVAADLDEERVAQIHLRATSLGVDLYGDFSIFFECTQISDLFAILRTPRLQAFRQATFVPRDRFKKIAFVLCKDRNPPAHFSDRANNEQRIVRVRKAIQELVNCLRAPLDLDRDVPWPPKDKPTLH